MTRRALVVFGDNTGLWWLRFLRPGFRHCFVVVETSSDWVVIDPLSHCLEVSVVPLSSVPDFRLACVKAGLRVVDVEIERPLRKAMPIGPFSCVECAKRVIGLKNRFVMTPWQLYEQIAKNKNIYLYTPRSSGIYPVLWRGAVCRYRALKWNVQRLFSLRRRNKTQTQEVDMGGIFGGAPSVPEPQPLPEPVDPEVEARKQRMEAVARNRRGRAGMLGNDERGILAPVAQDGKKLLGE
jgi:hypothetical protein